ncbi:MAG: oxidoreductase [Sneathiella sp.]|nr:MAG: oxidoreductase [Sneathiella sp.]
MSNFIQVPRRRIATQMATMILVALVTMAIFNHPLYAEEKQLEISGNINSEHGAIYFSPGDMAASKPVNIITTSPWTVGKTIFRGVLLRDILKSVKADGQLLKASAKDGYTVEIPISDAEKYDVIIAYRMDGKPLEDGVYAPFWIIYPYDTDTTLANEIYYSRSIWELTKLVIE